MTRHARRLFILSILVFAMTPPLVAGATLTIVNLDGANEGFNDPTPATPVGGNNGTTLGEQRMIAFSHAASIWGATLDSNVEIRVQAAFNPLGAGVLGSAGATFVFRDFTGAPGFPGAEFAATWYSSALADKRAGAELNPGAADINAQFSSNFNFYLGLDANHGGAPDLVAVLLHEFGHGLGFQTFVNTANGRNLGASNADPNGGFTDTYARHILDNTSGLRWNQMTAAERQTSTLNWGNVVWDGGNVTSDVPQVLVFGSPSVTVTSPASIAKTYQFGTAGFGAPIGSPNLSGLVASAEDVAEVGGTTTDGCSPLTNAAAVSGKIAIIERGLCTFQLKAKNAENAGAIGVIIYNNLANVNAAPPGMAADPLVPAVGIPVVSLRRADGLGIVAELVGGVSANIGVDLSIRAGADPFGKARLFAPNPRVGGSSISHYDSIASRNLLMEPAINADLTHSLDPPEDLTLNLMRDIGWFADADTDGIEDAVDNCPNVANADQANYDGDSAGDACDTDDDNDGVLDGDDAVPFSDIRPTVVIGTCDSGSPNIAFPNGETLMDRLPRAIASAKNHGDFVSIVNEHLNAARALGLLTGAQKGAIDACAAKFKP
jgi:hypothetical protein